MKMRAPGLRRRQALIDATSELLCERDIEDVSFRDIASRADVLEGSAYHFFANRFDIFSAVADTLSEKFIAAHEAPVPESKRAFWWELVRECDE